MAEYLFQLQMNNRCYTLNSHTVYMLGIHKLPRPFKGRSYALRMKVPIRVILEKEGINLNVMS